MTLANALRGRNTNEVMNTLVYVGIDFNGRPFQSRVYGKNIIHLNIKINNKQ